MVSVWQWVRTSMQGHVYSPVYRHVHEFCFPSLAISYFDKVLSCCCVHDHLFLSSKPVLVSIFWAFFRDFEELQSCQGCVHVEIIPVKSSPKREDWNSQFFVWLVLWVKNRCIKKLTRQWWEYKWNLCSVCVCVCVGHFKWWGGENTLKNAFLEVSQCLFQI